MAVGLGRHRLAEDAGLLRAVGEVVEHPGGRHLLDRRSAGAQRVLEEPIGPLVERQAEHPYERTQRLGMICAQQPRARRVRDHAVAGREHAVGREQAERALECLRVRSGGLRQGRGCLGRLAEHVGHPEVGHHVQATGEEPGRAHLHYHLMGRRCHAAPPRLRVTSVPSRTSAADSPGRTHGAKLRGAVGCRKRGPTCRKWALGDRLSGLQRICDLLSSSLRAAKVDAPRWSSRKAGMRDVFVSYATEDRSTAEAVCAALEAKGLRCWIAPRDIHPGRSGARP